MFSSITNGMIRSPHMLFPSGMTLDVGCCLDALDEALLVGKPDIFNSDQDVQFTCHEFTNRLLKENVQISMDGRGRALDNVFADR